MRIDVYQKRIQELTSQYFYWLEQLQELEEEEEKGKRVHGKQKITGNMDRISKEIRELDEKYTLELPMTDMTKEYLKQKEIQRLKKLGWYKK